ncbi:ubiquitin domain-containing protein [Blumeria hordei DH14]|uniref:Ubiquitin domain-containing protein n=1 Tax=Blumeria graminis f. sp. hordei (strain DH14) TaxID=546991 RepID=N1JBC6_BLUG1|nr:ubiquitin domain-containing protein [Blumeria hordei DH14]
MGCCLSIPSSHSASHRPHSSSSPRAISSSQPHDHTSNLNKPLRRQVWSSTERTWTNIELERERAEFFDTRTSGRPEVWQTMKAVLEILWASEDPKDATDVGLETAQQILDAAEIILPHSNISPGIYDSFGAYYPIPKHITSSPKDVIIINSSEQERKCKEDAHQSFEGTEDNRTREKGKCIIKPTELIKLRVKLSDRDAPPIQLFIDKEDTVRVVAQKILIESGMASTKTLRIAYMGKLLNENQSLSRQGWNEIYVVNGLIFD